MTVAAGGSGKLPKTGWVSNNSKEAAGELVQAVRPSLDTI